MGYEDEIDVLIVGAGFAGIYQLHLMREMGFRARVVERADDVGGTWYWNRYPGARCDVPSLAYSVSYLPQLDQEWDWPEAFSSQAEILRYIRHVVDRLDLRRDMTFRTAVTGAAWDAAAARWTVRLDPGGAVRCRFLVMATGMLGTPKDPEVPGLTAFEGRWFQTSRWPHEPVDFTGRRVAVIGTGSTGIQVVPIVAGQAAQLTVFQRTPKYSVPLANRALTDGERTEIKRGYPQQRRANRRADFGFGGWVPDYVLDELPPDEQDRILEEAWNAGRFPAFLTNYSKRLGLTNERVNDILAAFARRKIAAVVRDPATAELLTPRGYPIGVNRLCRDTGYYEAFNRPNVALLDTRADPIEAITPRGIRTASREIAVDDIVFAIGFDALTGPVTAIDPRGADGTAISAAWREGARTYLGVATSGFPNMFVVTGPGGPSALGNAIVTIEQNIEFIAALIGFMRERGVEVAEAEAEAERAWMEEVQAVSMRSLYRHAYKANAWYTGANIPGKKKMFLPYSGGVGTYQTICDRVAENGFEGFAFSGLSDRRERRERRMAAV